MQGSNPMTIKALKTTVRRTATARAEACLSRQSRAGKPH
jgi:hypothetical protein